MSLTIQQVIDKAAYELGILESPDSLGSTDTADALVVLNQLMAEWAINDMDLNWGPQDTVGDTAPIPTWAEAGVISGLAVKMGPVFRAPVPADLQVKADAGEQTIANALINMKVVESDMSHMPRGGGRYDIYNDTL